MNPNDIVLKVIDALSTAGIPYAVVGSFSSNMYGIERNTVDADFVLELESRTINEIIKLLGPEFSVDPQLSFETVTMTYRYVAAHLNPYFKIELFLLNENDPHDRERFAHRQPGIIKGRKVFFPRPEDVIITKLRWSKQGHRTKDIDDARNVLAVQQGRLDMAYIRNWCDQHGTRELLESTLQSIPPLPDAD